MNRETSLPPGQFELDHFPRFGLSRFATRFPTVTDHVEIQLGGDVRSPIAVSDQLSCLPRVEQRSDFHCVTTWTRRSLHWSGMRFADFYEQIVVPLAEPSPDATFVVLRGQDGARARLPLEDLLAPGVLLADRLDGEPLTIAHGAPIRLVASSHYGYKNLKHVNRIEFLRSTATYRPSGFRFMEHPRARVAHEERGQWVPGWILRYLYRPVIGAAMKQCEQALQAHLKTTGNAPPR